MKNRMLILLFVLAFALSSCGYHSTMMQTNNNSTTSVELSSNNFKVLGSVSGSATALYVMGIGGFQKRTLYDNAKAKMMANASLRGTSRALVNISSEEHISMVFPFFYTRSVTVSAYVVEFTGR